MTRIVYRDVPDAVRSEIGLLVERWAHLVPPWCEQVGVYFTNATDADDACSMDADPEYRMAKVYIHPAWLSEPPEMRERHIVHELVHVSIEPMAQFVADLLESADAGTVLERQWGRLYEGAVCDLAYGITSGSR